jgi:LPXTG-site transpeptidase (sortase) family protein
VLPAFLPKTGRSIGEKGVRIIRHLKTATNAMFPSQKYGFARIADAPTDYDFWRSRLSKADALRESIVVIPTIGIVAPINDMNWSGYANGVDDYALTLAGRSVSINQYLKSWVLHYPQTAGAWWVGNMVIFWHSSYFHADSGRYKTVFANLMELDPEEEVWVYTRSPITREITRYAYRVTNSYDTKPEDTAILLQWDEKAKITLFTCTPVGWIEWRWVIRGELIQKNGEACYRTRADGTHDVGQWKNNVCVQGE